MYMYICVCVYKIQINDMQIHLKKLYWNKKSNPIFTGMCLLPRSITGEV